MQFYVKQKLSVCADEPLTDDELQRVRKGMATVVTGVLRARPACVVCQRRLPAALLNEKGKCPLCKQEPS